MKFKIKNLLKSFLVMIGLFLPITVFAVSSLEFFPASFDQTIDLYAGDPWVIVARIINAVLMFLGVMAVVLVLYGGFVWMTAGGNEERIGQAKKILINAGIGLVIILSSFILTRFLFSRLLGSLSAGEATYEEGSSFYSATLPSGSFVVRGISPKGSVPLRNVKVRVVLNKVPGQNEENLTNNVVVSKKSDHSPVAGKMKVAGTTIEFTPDENCPAPNQNRKCFAAETDFLVEVKPGLKSADGKDLICGGLAPVCQAEFHTGSLIDVSPPTVSIESPDNGESISVDSCVPIQAKVSDDAGLASLEFYADDLLIPDGTIVPQVLDGSSSPREGMFELPCWDTTGLATPSSHYLKVLVNDIDENSATSQKVKVVVRPNHCFDNVKNDDEDGPDCDSALDGPSGCGLCDGAACKDNADCTGGNCDQATKTCVSYPKILDISPGDGKTGTFVTVSGLYFGNAVGEITFSDNKKAQAPAACSQSGSWSASQAIVSVPEGAVDGAIKLCTAGVNPLCDSTNDNRGPLVPTQRATGLSDGFFDVNDAAHPGLCLAYSPTEHTACTPGPAGDSFCQNENKDVQGKPDKTVFCSQEQKICVRPKGGWNTTVYLIGNEFGQEGYVSFGGQPKEAQSFTNTLATTVVPLLKYGGVKVQLVSESNPLAMGGSKLFGFTSVSAQTVVPSTLNYSNAVNYEVLSPDANTLPEITAINPEPAGPGQGVTISGRNFGATPGIVWFVNKTSGASAQGETNGLPTACESHWWQANEIKVRVPKVFSDQSEVKTGNYDVYVHRYDSVDSNREVYKIDTTLPPAPFIWCLDPSVGPRFINLTVYGEKFGSAPTTDNGLFFTSGINGTVSAQAVLTNTGGTLGGSCPSGGWSQAKICAQVPDAAASGAAQIKTVNDQGISILSNQSYFKVGSCLAPVKIKKDNKDVANPEYAACAAGATCCGDGACRDKCLDIPKSAYGWDFSTSPVKVVPRVVEECVQDSTEGGRFASPSPWSGRAGGDKACTNALAAARFDTVIQAETLGSGSNHPNVIFEKCVNGVEAENLASNGDFESTLAMGAGSNQWKIMDVSRLAMTQVTAPQDDLLDDAQTQADTSKALRLEKLQAEPDRSLNESVAGKRDGNEYTESFAAQFLPSLDAYGKSYKISIKVKAAETSDGKATAKGQKAGLLFRKLKAGIELGQETPADFEMEKGDEVVLKNDWQEISLTIKTEKTSGTAELILFLTSPPAGVETTTYHKYAAYFDDLKITSLDKIICNQATAVASSLEPKPNAAQVSGFTLAPTGGFEDSAWYRVTLKTDITAAGANGAQMVENAASCGAGNAYCWLFKTSNQKCKVGNIWTMPNPFTAKTQNELINYSALPVAAEDVCVNLDPSSFSWGWSVDDNGNLDSPPRVALSPQTGQLCQQDADCPIGVCSAGENKSCQDMDWTRTVTALAETDANPVLVESKITNAEYNPKPAGSAKLFIQFVDPVVTNYWPACQAACLNADLGAEFNIPMEAATLTAENLTTDNIKLYELTCGNGKIDLGEDCDDGNNINGDGCSSNCLNEGSNFSNKCGNGVINLGESCDDGNTVNGDGCSAKCLYEGTIAPLCGDGIKGTGEACDDGNTVNGDGCSAKCLNEGTRSDIAICGNGKIETGEECEKDLAGNWPPGNWCNKTTCLRQGSDASKCGNGKVDAGEDCDPKSPLLNGSTAKQALCTNGQTPYSTFCLWTGTAKPGSVGGVGCGNGKVEIGEDCDDGNTRAGDGCSAVCLNEGGVLMTSRSVCGNSHLDPGEDCDDGNTVNSDGCSAKCLNEGTTRATCGNGAKETGESCDWKILEATYGPDLAKLLCNPAACKNNGAITNEQKNQFTVANKPAPVCGNGVLNDGEDCDGGVGCSTGVAGCLHTGRSQLPLSIDIIPGPDQTLNGQTGPTSLTIQHPDLEPLATYRVVFSQNIKSKSGKNLIGLNYSSSLWPSNANNQPNAFSWTFTTKNERCAVDKVEVSPADASLYIIGAEQSYQSIPWSKPDACSAQGQRLTNLNYGWGWNSDDPSTTTLNDGASIATITNEDKILHPPCGDGIVEAGEQCDDGNIGNGDGCSATCQWEGSRYANKCGNGHLDTGEACDPPDPSGLICTARCLSGPMRAALFCTSANPTNCCGDGDTKANEECDDGNFVAGDGCSPYCTREGSFSPICGNGVVNNPSEQCDYGEAANWPGCDKNTCLLTGTKTATCGNGVVEWGEACDDRNLVSGDGCSSNCLLESAVAVSVSAVNMGVDPYQKATARGLTQADKNRGRTWSMTSVKSKITDVQLGDEASKDKEGSGALTVYCGQKDDIACAAAGGTTIDLVGRGDDSCCYGRPSLDKDPDKTGPQGVDACPNALITATFSTLMKDDSLAGNFILARGVAGKTCPAGTVPVDSNQGRVLTLVDNGSFEEPLIKRNIDKTIKYQPDDPLTTTVDESKLPQINVEQAEGWQFQVGTGASSMLGQDVLDNEKILISGDGHIGRKSLEEKSDPASQPVKAIKRVVLNSGVTYRLSAFYNVIAGNSQDGSARLSIRLGDVYENGFDVSKDATKGTWHLIYRAFKPPKTGEYTIELVAQKSIDILWDDVSLEVLAGAAPLSHSSDNIGTAKWVKNKIGNWKLVIGNFFRSLFGSSAQADASQVWCTGEISFTISAEKVANGSMTKVTLQPSKMLEKNAEYRLIVRGDQDLTDNIKEGVLSAAGVALGASQTGTDAWEIHGWKFVTKDKICAVDKVNIAVASPADGSGTKTAIKKAGASRQLTARAISLSGGTEQELQSLPRVYGWTWGWNDSDQSDVLATLISPRVTTPSLLPETALLTIKDKNGDDVVTATATFNPANTISSPTASVSGAKQFTIFICENPWPTSEVFPYSDGSEAQTAERPTNFSTMYCRDAGKSADTTDDLPDLGVGTVLTPDTDTSTAKSQVLKEFLFPVLPSGQDIIGIRVMDNPGWLSIIDWYNAQGFIGQPQPASQPIDGYEAIEDGQTVYVAAVNQDSGGKIYSNIYLISYNLDATAETKNIRDQIVSNFKLNINLPLNQRTCHDDIKINCTKDWDCLGIDYGKCKNSKCEKDATISCTQDSNCVINQGVCDAPKDKLTRDVTRMKSLKFMGQALENYKSAKGEYPRLEAGSYIRGLTNSKWPSWSAILGNALGMTLPDDPLGTSVGLYKCDIDAGPCTNGKCAKNQNLSCANAADCLFDKATCWNKAIEAFTCPAGSMLYFYKNIGPASYELGARFEYGDKNFTGGHYDGQNQWVDSKWVGFAPVGGGSFYDNFCPALGEAEIPPYSTNGYCGDGKIQSGETCELGQITTKDHIFTAGDKRCLLNPNKGTCATDADCQLTAISCTTDKKCSYNLGISCTNDDGCPFGAKCLGSPLTCTLSTEPKSGATANECRNTATDCDKLNTGSCLTLSGSGLIEQQCKSDCSGWQDYGFGYVTAYCGNGVVEGAEQCDDGLLNGQYGKCALDCSAQAIAGWCGDGIKNGPEKCDRQTYNYSTQTWSTPGTPTTPSTACQNGENGCCRSDCSGPGLGCGDHVVSEGEQCDGNSQTSQGYCDNSKQPCANDNGCDTTSSEKCRNLLSNNASDGICTESSDGYARFMTRSCNNDTCHWNSWGECVKKGGCGNGVKEGIEECDEGEKNSDTGNCTPVCKRPICRDGKIQSDKVCVSPASAKWQFCLKDSDCGTGGKCQATEACDMGTGNGRTCRPAYGLSCAYCGNNCQKAFVQGPYCGDGIVQDNTTNPVGLEQCDGSIASGSNWKCIGEPEKTDWWWDKWDTTALPSITTSARDVWNPNDGWYLLPVGKIVGDLTPLRLSEKVCSLKTDKSCQSDSECNPVNSEGTCIDQTDTNKKPLWENKRIDLCWDTTASGQCSGTTTTPCLFDADCPSGETCVITGNGSSVDCYPNYQAKVAQYICKKVHLKQCGTISGTGDWGSAQGTKYAPSGHVCDSCNARITTLECGVSNLNDSKAEGVVGNKGIGIWTNPTTSVKEVNKDASPSNSALQIHHIPGDKDIAVNFDAIPDTNGKKYKLTAWVKAGDNNAVGKEVKIVFGRKGGSEFTQGINTDPSVDEQRALSEDWQKIELSAPFPALTGSTPDPKGYIGLRVIDTGDCDDYTILFDKIHLEIVPLAPICSANTCFVSCPKGGVTCYGSNCDLDSDNDGDPDITDDCPQDSDRNSDTGTGNCAP